MHKGRVRLDIRGNFSSKEWCCSGTAAQGGDGVPILEGVPELWDVALRAVGSGHGGVGWGSRRLFPALTILWFYDCI